jgi:hypothetical protein
MLTAQPPAPAGERVQCRAVLANAGGGNAPGRDSDGYP